MDYPTLREVGSADRLQLAGWYRHLPFPENDRQHDVLALIFRRFEAMGGMTEELSKAIGWAG